MNLALLWSNLLAYSAQVLALVAVGALLPLVLRLRHPRAHLIYCQLLLVASLVLPALQPWPRPVIVVPVSSATPTTGVAPLPSRPPATPRFPIEQTVLLALGAGAVARALWLLVGLMRLRRYRANATPLYPLPAAMEAARERTGAEAVVCLSQDVGGPVTFGVLYPVILLPPAVLDQPAEAQFGIACHEFLHVRRHDWLLTVCEELAGALVWFHPAVWWLLGQIRLAREQVVDRAVVSLAEARDPYVQALLQMGGAWPQLDLAPAALFLRKRHLANRIHSLLKEVSVSKRRLVSSYVSIAAMLALTAWFVVASFPLQGSPQTVVQQGAVADAPGVSVETGGRILHRTPVQYPADLISQGIQGVMTLELTLDSTGSVSDAHVLAGPEELRRSALQSVLQWHYVKDASTPPRVQVTIDFRVPLTPRASTTPPVQPPPEFKALVQSVDVSSIPEPLQSTMRSRVAPFEGQPFSPKEFLQAIREVDPHAAMTMTVPRPGAGGAPAVALRVVLLEGAPTPATPPPPPAPGVQRIQVGGAVQASKLIQSPPPVYPPLAQQARIQGLARFTAIIGVDGKVQSITVVSGHPLLIPAAQEAVKQYVYQPTLLNGQPVEVVTQIDVNFSLQ